MAKVDQRRDVFDAGIVHLKAGTTGALLSNRRDLLKAIQTGRRRHHARVELGLGEGARRHRADLKQNASNPLMVEQRLAPTGASFSQASRYFGSLMTTLKNVRTEWIAVE